MLHVIQVVVHDDHAVVITTKVALPMETGILYHQVSFHWEAWYIEWLTK